ncbi:MAG: transcription antitermination factor NusB [Phycisphaeraceae bacterium]|nr:transcription antitermination factor NusB [Phycisphaeraceae bacterium]
MTTPSRRDLRRLAMQVLYQLDVTAPKHNPGHAPTVVASAEELAEALDEEHDTLATRKKAAELALLAWADHTQADEATSALTPDWPTHRQPPVDRAILRLAYFEIASGHAPVKVAINEAVELAKQFGSEQSPPFINGVLDKLARAINDPKPDGVAGETQSPVAEPPTDADAWLDDAMEK